jgi:hypothetical protein
METLSEPIFAFEGNIRLIPFLSLSTVQNPFSKTYPIIYIYVLFGISRKMNHINTTFKINLDSQTNLFNPTYPIQLKGIISPNEFDQFIDGANKYLKSLKRTTTIAVILWTVFGVCLMGGMIGSAFTIFASRNVFIFFGIFFGVFFAVAIVMVGVAFWMNSRRSKIYYNLRRYLSNSPFVNRGVQFVFKESKWLKKLYIEVTISPTAPSMSDFSPAFQPTIYNSSTFVQEQQLVHQPMQFQQPYGYNMDFQQQQQGFIPQYGHLPEQQMRYTGNLA